MTAPRELTVPAESRILTIEAAARSVATPVESRTMAVASAARATVTPPESRDMTADEVFTLPTRFFRQYEDATLAVDFQSGSASDLVADRRYSMIRGSDEKIWAHNREGKYVKSRADEITFRHMRRTASHITSFHPEHHAGWTGNDLTRSIRTQVLDGILRTVFRYENNTGAQTFIFSLGVAEIDGKSAARFRTNTLYLAAATAITSMPMFTGNFATEWKQVTPQLRRYATTSQNGTGYLLPTLAMPDGSWVEIAGVQTEEAVLDNTLPQQPIPVDGTGAQLLTNWDFSTDDTSANGSTGWSWSSSQWEVSGGQLIANSSGTVQSTVSTVVGHWYAIIVANEAPEASATFDGQLVPRSANRRVSTAVLKSINGGVLAVHASTVGSGVLYTSLREVDTGTNSPFVIYRPYDNDVHVDASSVVTHSPSATTMYNRDLPMGFEAWGARNAQTQRSAELHVVTAWDDKNNIALTSPYASSIIDGYNTTLLRAQTITTTSRWYGRANAGASAGARVVATELVKGAGYRRAALQLWDNRSGNYGGFALFDLVDKTLVDSSAIESATIEDDLSGFYRLTLTRTVHVSATNTGVYTWMMPDDATDGRAAWTPDNTTDGIEVAYLNYEYGDNASPIMVTSTIAPVTRSHGFLTYNSGFYTSHEQGFIIEWYQLTDDNIPLDDNQYIMALQGAVSLNNAILLVGTADRTVGVLSLINGGLSTYSITAGAVHTQGRHKVYIGAHGVNDHVHVMDGAQIPISVNGGVADPSQFDILSVNGYTNAAVTQSPVNAIVLSVQCVGRRTLEEAIAMTTL